VLLALALFSTLSRGPWVGFAVFLMVYMFVEGKTARLFMLMLVGFPIAVLIILSFPGGEAFIELLPFTGGEHDGSVDFREDLLAISLNVIEQQLWLGSTDWRYEPAFDPLRQGSGSIDMTNTYLQYTLNTGIIGLAAFLLIFLSVFVGLIKARQGLPKNNTEGRQLGAILIAVLSAIVVVLGTVSSIDYIPVYYWAIVGLSVAWVRKTKRDLRAREQGGHEESSPGNQP
jgi:O-antigen ligase